MPRDVKRASFARHNRGKANLADSFANLDDLGGAGGWVALDLAALGPAVSVVVMIDVAKQQARRGLVGDQADVGADAHGPEVGVLCPVELVKLHPGARRVHLEVERRGLGGGLLLARELSETVGEGVGDAEVHIPNRLSLLLQAEAIRPVRACAPRASALTLLPGTSLR